jgi:hypothetical protein
MQIFASVLLALSAVGFVAAQAKTNFTIDANALPLSLKGMVLFIPDLALCESARFSRVLVLICFHL